MMKLGPGSYPSLTPAPRTFEGANVNLMCGPLAPQCAVKCVTQKPELAGRAKAQTKYQCRQQRNSSTSGCRMEDNE